MEAIKILWYFEPSKIDQQLRRPRPHVGRSTSLHNFMRIFCSFWFYFNLQFYKLLTALTQRSSPMGYNKGKQSKCYILYKKNTHLVHAVCNILTTLFSISLVARSTAKTPSSYTTNSQNWLCAILNTMFKTPLDITQENLLYKLYICVLSLTGKKYELFEPAKEEETESLESTLSIFESNIKFLSLCANVSKFRKFKKF